ncbi:MAG: cobalt-precorrin 5A hydrolase [Pseudomonadota bacterium]
MLKNKKDKPIAIWAITPNGRALGLAIQEEIHGAILFISLKIDGFATTGLNIITFDNLAIEIARQFNCFSGHIFIFATGIAVRMIAPLLKSKTIDPAVVVVDEKGNHAISLISGHIGGANLLTNTISSIIGARPVITTATDTNQVPAIDMIAKDLGLFIETPENIKHINMAFLTSKKVFLHDPLGLLKPFLANSFWEFEKNVGVENRPGGLIFCDYKTESVSRETLILRPLVLIVGIGCNRGTSLETIKDFLELTLKQAGLSKNSILKIATSDVKKDEGGLLSLANEMHIDLEFYSKDELNSVTDIPTPSKMVEKHLGVKSVCEAAAILSAENGTREDSGQKNSNHKDSDQKDSILILPKQKNKDVTIAVAIIK